MWFGSVRTSVWDSALTSSSSKSGLTATGRDLPRGRVSARVVLPSPKLPLRQLVSGCASQRRQFVRPYPSSDYSPTGYEPGLPDNRPATPLPTSFSSAVCLECDGGVPSPSRHAWH